MTAREIIDAGLYDQAVALMDDEIRERVHAETSPCTDEEFLDAYITYHMETFGEPFTI